MITLTNPVTGHEVHTDEASADFWKGAGYRAASSEDKPRATRKTATKKAARKS